MSPRLRAWAAIDWFLLCLALLGSLFAIILYPGPFGADAHAVYLPIARGLLDGYGLHAFAPMVQGSGRLPGQGTLLALASASTGDLRTGVALLNATSMVSVLLVVFFAVRRAGARAPWPGVAACFLALEPNLLNAAGRALPDAVAVGFVALSFAVLLASDRHRRGYAALLVAVAGLLAGMGVLVRINLIALWPAGLAFLAFRRRPGFGWMMLLFTTASLSPLLVVSPISDALLELRLIYPRGTIEEGIVGGQAALSGESAVARILAAILRGSLELPTRLWKTVGAPWVIVGVPALWFGVFRRPNDPVRVLAVSCLSFLLLALVPIHFEARYYTFAAPFLVGASVVAIDAFISGPWARTFAVSIACALALLFALQLPHRKQTLEARRDGERVVQAACAHLEALRGEAPALFVTFNSPKYQYSRFHECETSVRRGPRIFVVPSIQGQHSAEVRLSDAKGQRRYRVDRPDLRAQFSHYLFDQLEPREPADERVELAKPRGAEVLSRRWRKRLPTAMLNACQGEKLELAPGRYRMHLRLDTKGSVAARAQLSIGTSALTFFGANGMTHERIVEFARGRKVGLGFCAISPLRSGEIALELRLYAIPAEPEHAGESGP